MEPGATRDYPPPPMPRPPGRTHTIVSFALAGVAVLILPMLLGPVAVLVGAAGRRRGDPLGRWAVATGVVATIAGLVLLAAVNDR
jgi:hypothetical protein